MTMKLEELIQSSGQQNSKQPQAVIVQEKASDSKNSQVVKGKPKSGRVWKSDRKRFSSIVKSKGIRNSFKQKEALRADLGRIKEMSKARLTAKKEEREAKRERTRENLKRQEENRKKSEVVQVITNTKKLKRMKKKQLRYVEKRDTLPPQI